MGFIDAFILGYAFSQPNNQNLEAIISMLSLIKEF